MATVMKALIFLLLNLVAVRSDSFPVDYTKESSHRLTMNFLNARQMKKIKTCNPSTDLTFKMQRDNSRSRSTIKYYRLDTNVVETFSFMRGGGPTNVDHTHVRFDGKSLTCRGNKRGQHACNNLPVNQAVPVVLLAIDFNPSAGAAWKGQRNRNRYTIKGSFYRANCGGSSTGSSIGSSIGSSGGQITNLALQVGPCTLERNSALEKSKMIADFHVPGCNADGTFKPMQCYPMLGCVCVDKNGKEIAGTMTRMRFGRPDCGALTVVNKLSGSWNIKFPSFDLGRLVISSGTVTIGGQTVTLAPSTNLRFSLAFGYLSFILNGKTYYIKLTSNGVQKLVTVDASGDIVDGVVTKATNQLTKPGSLIGMPIPLPGILQPQVNVPSDPCVQPKDDGHCRANVRKYYFDQSTRSCQQFTFGGCGGNDNKFATKEECVAQCGVQYTTQTHDGCANSVSVEDCRSIANELGATFKSGNFLPTPVGCSKKGNEMFFNNGLSRMLLPKCSWTYECFCSMSNIHIQVNPNHGIHLAYWRRDMKAKERRV